MPENAETTARTRLLTRDDIISTALKMVDEKGLDALSFRSLGKRLGVSQTAFYRHLPDKAALLDGVSERIWLEALDDFSNRTADLNSDTATQWQTVMHDYAQSLHSVLLRHPNAVELVLTHPISTPRQFAQVARVLTVLSDEGFRSPSNMLALVTAVTVYTTGFSAAEAAPPAGGAASNPSSGFSEALSLMPNDDRRTLKGLVGQVMTGRWDFSTQFEVGLKALLNGWES